MKTALRPKQKHSLEEPVNLTSRQHEILNLVSLGHTNREMASILKISVRTVEVHRFSLMRKLNVRNVAQLLGRAIHFGLLSTSGMRAHLGDREKGAVLQFSDGRNRERKLVHSNS